MNYFSDDAEATYSMSFVPSPTVGELALYLREFAAKLSQTMIHAKGKNFNSYNLSDIDESSLEITEADNWLRTQLALCVLDLFGSLFLRTEREL